MLLKLLLDSNHLFRGEEITPELTLLEGWSKNSLIRLVARINYLIHPNSRVYNKTGNCIDIWNKITYSDKQIATTILANALTRNTIQKEFWFQEAVLFNRLTNLHIIKKILVLDLYNGHDFTDNITEKQLINFLKFYSSCTKEVLSHEKAETPEGFSRMETMAFKNLPQHVFNSPLDISMSYFELIHSYLNYTFSDSELKIDFEKYFEKIRINKTDFLKHYLGGIFHSFRNTAKPESIEFTSQKQAEGTAKAVFNNLSEWELKMDENIFDYSSIKKYPFYKISDSEYIKLDHDYAIQKFYPTIYDDCFFDYLKPNGKTIKWFNGCRGIINEQVITHRLNRLFLRQRHIKLKFWENLKYDSNGNPLGIEIADYYARKGSKVFIAEIKSSSMSIAQMSGKIDDILSKSGNDFSEFLEKFGINQLVQHVKRLIENPVYFEKELPNKLKIYPTIIVSERAINSPLIVKILRNKFNVLIKEEIGDTDHTIKPLCVIQDTAVFRIEASRIGKLIWYILDKHGRDQDNGIMGGTIEMRLNRLGIKEMKRKFNIAYMAGIK
jgi:hypothetical protein